MLTAVLDLGGLIVPNSGYGYTARVGTGQLAEGWVVEATIRVIHPRHRLAVVAVHRLVEIANQLGVVGHMPNAIRWQT